MIHLLSGWSGSGKDATASILVEKYQFVRLAFADVLKNMIAEEYNFPVRWTTTEIGKQTMLPCGKTVRQCLIQRGQEIRQERGDPGFFARQVAREIQQLPPTQNIVISDWRFPIELETLQRELPDRQILQIRVQRQNQEASWVKDDFTEHQLDAWPFEYILQNSGLSITNLEKTVSVFLNNIYKETE